MPSLKSIALAALLAIVMGGCPINPDDIATYSVQVSNTAGQRVPVHIQMPGVTKYLTVGAGGIVSIEGYGPGSFQVTIIIESEKARQLARLTQLRDQILSALGGMSAEQGKRLLSQIHVVNGQLDTITQSGLPACGGTLSTEKTEALVALTFVEPTEGQPGSWSCG